MNYKIEKTLKKSKNIFIVVAVLWVILSIVLVSPITVSIVESTENGIFDFGQFTEDMFSNITNIGSNLSKVFTSEYVKIFWKTEAYFSIFLLFCAVIGISKAVPKHEYSDIEHGSSDWATGEQYEVLSKKKGILLAENHYLPVDKRGNTNVLVVGRFRFW